MLRHIKIPALVVGTALFVAFPAVAQADSNQGGPQATAAKNCGLGGKERSLGPTYTTSLSVKRTSCAKGYALVTAYYNCRVRNGKKGRCVSKVNGYSCSERRSSAIPTQFSASVSCTKGRKKVTHSYTQFT